MTNSLDELLPIVKLKCEQFLTECKKEGINVVVTGTLRTFAEQDALYAKGRTTAGPIVTNAKGRQSLHNWGVAFDCVPVVSGVTTYNDDVLWSKLEQIGDIYGLEWGGNWSSFPDKPHFQYTLGHSWQDFLAGTVDLSKFNLPIMETPDVHVAESHEEVEASVGKEVTWSVTSKVTSETYPVTEVINSTNEIAYVTSIGTITFTNDNGVQTNPDYTLNEN